ncbi:MAG: hypothetical protein Q9191_000101 [Dirinaria sp. TL-2023a]
MSKTSSTSELEQTGYLTLCSSYDSSNQGRPVSANISYALSLKQNLRTLSTNNANNIDDLEGFLYVPYVTTPQACASTQYIPQNVTRHSDIPSSQYNFVAYVPWISADCTHAYLTAANDDNGVAAFITYVPNNSTNIPPPVNDPQWDLNDGGRWKADSQFPVYAIPGASGYAVMQQLPNYSGNISTVKNGAELLKGKGATPTDLVRMYVEIQTKAQSNLPSLWAFLLIVLGIVLFLVACTSFVMHWYQRRARRRLRDRIAQGEVDLEALGIKRLTVPQEFFDKLPVYTYTADQRVPGIPDAAAATPMSRRASSSPRSSHQPPGDTITSHDYSQAYSQSTCAICLDEFVPNVTPVTELPCRHIYHTECAHQLLTKHSSLCPVCKTKVLPLGYFPERITNLMVRRERQHRRGQGNAVVVSANQRLDAGAGVGGDPSSHQRLAVGRRMASFHRQFGRRNRSMTGRRSPSATVASNNAVEMADRAPPGSVVTTNAGPLDAVSPERAAGDRTERARRRISTLLGHRPTVEDEEREEAARMPKCKVPTLLKHPSKPSITDYTNAGRKAVGSVFPGFR